MNLALQRSELRDLAERVLAGERLSETDGLRLLESTDLHALGAMANTMRRTSRRWS